MKVYQIRNLIKRITNNSQSNNDSFTYYGYNVLLQSGSFDYVVASVKTEDSNIMEFDFDFLTKELNITFADSDETLDTIINSFKEIYRNVKVSIEDWFYVIVHYSISSARIVWSFYLPIFLIYWKNTICSKFSIIYSLAFLNIILFTFKYQNKT